MLSRPPTKDKGEADNWDLTLLPPHLFLRAANKQLDPWAEIMQLIKVSQQKWEKDFRLQCAPDRLLYHEDQLVIPSEDSLKRLILRQYHDAPTARHPRRDETIKQVRKTFWWPQMAKWIDEYIKGCATCHQNKVIN